MEITYLTKILRRICLNKNSAYRQLGSAHAEYLHARLADIKAAENLKELSMLTNLFAIDLDNGNIFSRYDDQNLVEAVPILEPSPQDDTNNHVDWTIVFRIKIITIRGIK